MALAEELNDAASRLPCAADLLGLVLGFGNPLTFAALTIGHDAVHFGSFADEDKLARLAFLGREKSLGAVFAEWHEKPMDYAEECSPSPGYIAFRANDKDRHSLWVSIAYSWILVKAVRPPKRCHMSDVTHILSQIDQGNPAAAVQLLPLVYDELRKLAAAKLAQERPGQTLQATALVHEAYLR